MFIANDWHTALIPCYLKTIYKPKGIYTSAKVGTCSLWKCLHKISGQPPFYSKVEFCFVNILQVAFCIHNIAYQGRFAFSDFSLLGLPDELKSSFDFIDGYDFDDLLKIA